MSLLEVRDLHVDLATVRGTARPVRGVSFDVDTGEIVALVGESGCGTSITAFSLLRLLPAGGTISAGEVRVDGANVATMSERELRRVRGAGIGMIYQSALDAMNPTITIGRQIDETIRAHEDIDAGRARQRTIELLGQVGMPSPAERADAYPHQLSGGMRQRALIAMALSCHPRVLIADEPTTALDVTIQDQILALLRSLTDSLGLGVLLITHDMSVVAAQADRVLVMYAGRIVETGPTADVLAAPQHPYTQALITSVPRLDQPADSDLPMLPGLPPSALAQIQGCAFADRCPIAIDRCRVEDPELLPVAEGRQAACHLVPAVSHG